MNKACTLNCGKVRTLWVSDTQPLDVFLHKASLLSIADQFAEDGNLVTLLASKSKKTPQSGASKTWLKLFPLRFSPIISPIIYALAVSLSLPLMILSSRPSYVVLEYDITALTALPTTLLSKLTKTKFVLDIRSIPVEATGFRVLLHTLKFSASVLVAKKAFGGITILTPAMRDEVCHKYGLAPEKVGVWTSGVSQSLFNRQKCAAESAQLKTDLGLDGKFVVFYHGILTATRGLKETVQAIELLKDKYPDIVFFVLGSGPIASELKTLAKQLHLEANVFVHDSVEQASVPKFIGFCDAGIVPLPNHPYWNYQSPLKLLEYMSMEKPVILSDIPAHRYVVGEEKCGIYIPTVNPSEIAKSIEYAYLNRDQLPTWGKVGRGIVEKGYTWQKVAVELEDYLLSLKEAA